MLAHVSATYLCQPKWPQCDTTTPFSWLDFRLPKLRASFMPPQQLRQSNKLSIVVVRCPHNLRFKSSNYNKDCMNLVVRFATQDYSYLLHISNHDGIRASSCLCIHRTTMVFRICSLELKISYVSVLCSIFFNIALFLIWALECVCFADHLFRRIGAHVHKSAKKQRDQMHGQISGQLVPASTFISHKLINLLHA